jgi:hypothetical protein
MPCTPLTNLGGCCCRSFTGQARLLLRAMSSDSAYHQPKTPSMPSHNHSKRKQLRLYSDLEIKKSDRVLAVVITHVVIEVRELECSGCELSPTIPMTQLPCHRSFPLQSCCSSQLASLCRCLHHLRTFLCHVPPLTYRPSPRTSIRQAKSTLRNAFCRNLPCLNPQCYLAIRSSSK